MDSRLPLPTLLSHVLVAFTIEFDNEFEHQTPHRTTNHGSTANSSHAPWLVSMVMWWKFMRFVPDEGISAGELRRRMGTTDKDMHAWLTRMGQWWGYVTIEPAFASNRSKRIPPDAVVRPTTGGRKAQTVWRTLVDTIEKRWQERFGGDKIDRLRESLYAVVNQLDAELPDYLPILGHGLFTIGPDCEHRALDGRGPDHASNLPLSALLSKVLLSFALEFEHDSEISIAISANVLRIFGEHAEREKGVYVRDLPHLTAVSKEAIAMSLSFLQKHGYAIVKPESPGSRVKVLALTPKGWHGRDVYRDLVWAIEERWQARFSEVIVHALRESLEYLVGEPTRQRSPLFHGLEPYPEGWRASIPKPEGLPHYPMVLHRGGFPDGS